MEYVITFTRLLVNGPIILWLSALDYPPFFAYFEYILSIPAYLVDPKIVDINNLRYDSWSAVAYQRTTVMLTELVLGAAVLRYASLLSS
jgi:hypothetical protein